MTATLAPDDIGFFFQSLAASRGLIGFAAKDLCAEFELGPRGPWIIGLIGKQPLTPAALADNFNVGRSLITAELNKLTDAGLVEQKRDAEDGRRTVLSLTQAGQIAYERLGEDLRAFLSERLSGYSRAEIMLCARILDDFAKAERP